eukprot:TRINITY_DN17802_c0_g1_i1.p1 TRINITY_DN17802_c0_g1~~TRINITY_DN17802_c0_g1_i1.p1  ORF type:complete len:242 (+),score=37.19 TRINITY_DN17802_c0_g1_i1:93-728(+)
MSSQPGARPPSVRPPPRSRDRPYDSDDSADGPECRICGDPTVDEATGPLLAPCKCVGTLRHVHRGCLAYWRKKQLYATTPDGRASSYNACEVCGFEYRVQRGKLLPLSTRLRRAWREAGECLDARVVFVFSANVAAVIVAIALGALLVAAVTGSEVARNVASGLPPFGLVVFAFGCLFALAFLADDYVVWRRVVVALSDRDVTNDLILESE